MQTECKNTAMWVATPNGPLIPECPGGEHDSRCCMHSAHMADMKSWKYPLVSYLVYAIRESGRGPAGLPSDKFTGNEEQDWKTIADYINFLIDFWVGIKIHDSSNPLSDLAVKINQAVTNRQLTIIKQTVTPISGPVGYTTADAVVAGYHPELVQSNR